MLYSSWRRTHTHCPFCGLENRILKTVKHAYLTYALAPYAPNHLLVIPKRHVVSFLKLTKAEEKDIDTLLKLGASVLAKLKVKDFSILVRDGGNRAKSVPHLHYHIIPKHRIGDLDKDGKGRRVLTTRQIDLLMRKLRKIAK
jgi:diadenosine tetraphosphate (Ap4A) HIT family hydrolase